MLPDFFLVPLQLPSSPARLSSAQLIRGRRHGQDLAMQGLPAENWKGKGPGGGGGKEEGGNLFPPHPPPHPKKLAQKPHTHTHASHQIQNFAGGRGRRRKGPNQRRTLDELPPELRCRNFVNNHRPSMRIGAERGTNVCTQTCTTFRLSSRYACHSWWSGKGGRK